MPPKSGNNAYGANFVADQKQQLPIVATKEGCHGGTFIVTGSNTGLGYEAAKHFVRLSPAKVILAVRSPAKGEEAKTKIEADTGIKGVAEVWPLDMGSYDSIIAFAEKVNDLERVDAIVENAGVALRQWRKVEGNEETIMVNVLGTMLLAALVMPKLKETAKKFGIQPHLSIVGSGAAFTAAGVLEGIKGDIIDGLNDESRAVMSERYEMIHTFGRKHSDYIYRYPLSKLVELYATREYASLNPLSATGGSHKLCEPRPVHDGIGSQCRRADQRAYRYHESRSGQNS